MSTNVALNIALRRLASQKKPVAAIPADAGNPETVDLAAIDAMIERGRARWASVLATCPAVAAAWAAWRKAGNPIEGLTTIAEAAIAARVPWSEGQPFNSEPWRAWAG
jgi:hypothetical protein